MSRKNDAVSATVPRQRCRVFPRGNPCSVLTAVFMLLLVAWSHVVFYQSTIVALRQRESTLTSSSTAILPPSSDSRLQTEIAQSHWTSSEHLNASITTHGSLRGNLTTTAEQWLRKTDAKWDSRIVVGVGEASAGGRPKEAAAETVSGVDDVNDDVNNDVYQTEAGSRDSEPVRRRGSSRDREARPADWKAVRRSRLLTMRADNQSLERRTPSPTSSSSTSPPRLVGWFAFYATVRVHNATGCTTGHASCEHTFSC